MIIRHLIDSDVKFLLTRSNVMVRKKAQMHHCLCSNNSGIAKRLNRMNRQERMSLRLSRICRGFCLRWQKVHIRLDRKRASVVAGLLLLKFGEFELLTFEQCANPQSHGMLLPRCKYSNYS